LDDARLELALQTVWKLAGVQGCYGQRYVEPAAQPLVPVTLESVRQQGHIFGVLRLPSQIKVACGALLVREEDGPDWVDLYVPMGALERADPRVGGFPFGEDGGSSSLAWRRPIDDWLAEVASDVYRVVPFELALIGMEASGSAYAEELQGAPPETRSHGYILPSGGAPRYHAANV
jgi:hypothetical protein